MRPDGAARYTLTREVLPALKPVVPHHRLRRQLRVAGLLFLIVFLIGAGGAAPRYNRVVYGALPLTLALMCFGGVAYLSGLPRRTKTVLSVCCWLLAIGVLATWLQPSLAGAAKPEPRIERAHVLLTLPRDRLRATLFAELQPVELLNCHIERFGRPHDGGYLMCSNLLRSVTAGYSYGVAGEDQWGCDIARRFRVRVHQYDCFDLRQPVCSDGATVFHPECIGPSYRTDEHGRIFNSLEDQFTNNGDTANHVVVKMDVEGAEWDTLRNTPSTLFERIDQLAIELHGTGLEHQLDTVRRLKEFFYVADLHFNNFTCAERIDPFPAPVYEVLFVNKRIATTAGLLAARPHQLDAPNSANLPDCQIPTTRWSNAIPGILRGFLR
jgi:hypothetical protein